MYNLVVLYICRLRKMFFMGGANLEKEKYELTELEIIVFQTEDIIAIGGQGKGNEDDETQIIPGH